MADPKYLAMHSSPIDKDSFFSGWRNRVYRQNLLLSPGSDNDGLNYWRARILFSIVATGAGISFLALVPGIYLALTTKRWFLLVADTAGFILMFVLLFSSRFGQKVQSLIVLLITFTIGVVIIIQVGFLSGGPIWLFSFSVAASVLFGLRAALATALLNGTVIILLAWLSFPGQTVEQAFLSSLGRSIAALGSFVILNIIVSISVAVLVNGLKNLNQSAVAAAADLKQEKTALLKTRERLTTEIGERKRTAQDLERARDAAEASNRAKSEFLANMGHELRTPLNHILGFTELVVDKKIGGLNAEQEDFLKEVLQSGRHLLALVNGVLDLSKVEVGRMELSLSRVFLRLLMENTLMMVKEKTLKQRIELIAHIPDQPDSFPGDESKLKQVLYNLLANALKFTPEGGTIQVRAALENGFSGGDKGLRFSVIDSGIGLDPGDLDRIFRPFEQADNSISRRFQGAGLGLALSRKLVELHGGRIWAESEGEGKGSAFHFVVPFPEGDPPGPAETGGKAQS